MSVKLSPPRTPEAFAPLISNTTCMRAVFTGDVVVIEIVVHAALGMLPTMLVVTEPSQVLTLS